MVDYAAKQLKAYNSISNYGVSISVQVSSLGTYDSETDSRDTTTTSYSTYMLIDDYTAEQINGTLIMAGDKKGIIPAYGLPRLDQLSEESNFTIVQGGRTLNIKNIKCIVPGGTALLYEFTLRGY